MQTAIFQPSAASTREQSPAGGVVHTHIPALDAIRGLAILAVTLYRFRHGAGEMTGEHLGWIDNSLCHLLELGNRGVDLFFVLSGFLITGILFDAQQKDAHYFRNFYARRSLRIFPLYYVSLILFLLVLPALITMPRAFDLPRENQSWLWFYGSNIYMSAQGEWCFGSLDHFWSLAVEEHFYLIWPLVIYLSTRTGAMTICAAIAATCAISRIGVATFTEATVAVDVATWFRCDALLIGAFCALAARGPNGIKGMLPYAKIVFAVALLACIPSLALPYAKFKTIPHTMFALLSASVIVLAVGADPKGLFHRFWQNGLLRTLGKYSYAMYVVQAPLIPLMAHFYTQDQLTGYLGQTVLGRVAYIALMSAVTFLLAVLSWNVLEKHCLKFKHYFEAKRELAPTGCLVANR